jgi:uncharacterized membrane protein
VVAWYTDNTTWLKGACAVALTGLLFPSVFRPTAEAWFWFGRKISILTSAIVLTVIFFLLIWPVALLRKIRFSRKRRSDQEEVNTYFISRDHMFTRNDLEHLS